MALVLNRKRGEAIYIGDSIKVIIGRIKDGSVRVVVDAPLEFPIRREELKLRDEGSQGTEPGTDAIFSKTR